MQTIIGKVSALDPSEKRFTVIVAKSKGGPDGVEELTFAWSDRTDFVAKGKDKASSSHGKLKVGMNVIVQAPEPTRPSTRVGRHAETHGDFGGFTRTTGEGTGAPRSVPGATVIWHDPDGGVIELTPAECRDLGGTVHEDGDCPKYGHRCTTTKGSRCIDELTPK